MQPPSGFTQYPRGTQGGGFIPTRGPGVYFDLFSKAFEIVKSDFATFALGAFVLMLASYAITLPVSLISNVLMYGSPLGSTTANPLDSFKIGGIAPALLLNIAATSATYPLFVGLQFAAYEYAETGQTSFASLFSGFKKFGQLFIVGLITYTLTFLGACLCLVPGLVAAAALMCAPQIVMNEDMKAMDAIKASIERSKAHLGSLTAFILVGGLIVMAGVLVCCVGFFVTLPIYYAAMALQYRELRPVTQTNPNPFM